MRKRKSSQLSDERPFFLAKQRTVIQIVGIKINAYPEANIPQKPIATEQCCITVTQWTLSNQILKV